MANPLFEDQKVALGVGAVVISGCLMAAIVFSELSGDEAAEQPVVEEAYAEESSGDESSAASSGGNSSAADDGGWADGGALSDDWGAGAAAAAVAPPNQDGEAGGGDASPDFGDFALSGTPQTSRPSEQPGVKSGAAPGAPAVRPPYGGAAQGKLELVGN